VLISKCIEEENNHPNLPNILSNKENKMKYKTIFISLLVACSVILAACAAPEAETIIQTVIVEQEGEIVEVEVVK